MVTILHHDMMESFQRKLESTEAIFIPIFVDTVAHPCNNHPSLIYIRFLDYGGEEFIHVYDHSEAEPSSVLPKYFSNEKYKYVPNRKEMLHVGPFEKLIDVNLLQYVNSGIPIDLHLEDTKAHTLIKRNFPNHRNLNRVIPLSKHIEACRVLSLKMIKIIMDNVMNINTPPFQFLNFAATDVFQQIERVGIHVDRRRFGPEFTRHISDGNLTYSEYNFFTSTGRPSNRFGGMNFAALNREDGTRKAFTSRFGKDDGMMVYIDYDAYHLRLIAELLGFKFPPGNVHDYLGKMYFKVNELTEEQYDESKRISFHMLYGGIKDEYRSVPFFARVQKFVDFLWDDFQSKGCIVSPIGQRELYRTNMGHMHPQKLFNYFIQLHETEQNVMALEKVLPLFHKHNSKLVLYTYDSILIDFDITDGIELIHKVKTTLECESTYPVKVYVGNNYQELTNVTDRFHV